MTIAAPDFDFICDFVRKGAAIVLEPGKEYLAETRLGPVARGNGFGSISEMVDALRSPSSRELQRQVLEAMTTNETSFFRDTHPFESLRETVLPDLVERRRASRRLRIWCGASSSGQEPYSIAMTIAESFPEVLEWDLEILCTDLSTQMLERTAAGRFSQLEVNRGLPARLLVKWFTRNGAHYEASEELRRLIVVRELNLAAPWHDLPTADLVFLRNVLIYFDVATKQQILRRVHQHLAPDGYLILGGAETTLNLSQGYKADTMGRTTWFRPVPEEGR